MKTKSYSYDTDKDTNINNGNTSCLVTCTTSDIDDDLCKGSFTYEAEEVGGNELGCLTSCVRTRWFQAAELLYGSTYYGLKIDLWSLGCVFAKLLTSKPLFPGTSDIDQLSRIVSVLGNINGETWPGCSKLSDYGSISFGNVENPSGLEACMPNCYPNEVSLVQRLVCYDPTKRTTTMELLQDKYFSEEPLPVPISELRVPLTTNRQDQYSSGGHNEMGSDSDLEEFGTLNITTTASIFETLGVTSLSGKFSLVSAFEEGNEFGYLDKKDLDTCGPESEFESHPVSKMKSSKHITPYCEVIRTPERNDFPVSLDNKNSLDQLKQYDVFDNCSDHHFFHEGEKIDIISCQKLAKHH
ncbi:hypothetical protein JHK82_055684 [Glycine max]|nr:hypothetical protein JHK82_055684 [Glycine max]